MNELLERQIKTENRKLEETSNKIRDVVIKNNHLKNQLNKLKFKNKKKEGILIGKTVDQKILIREKEERFLGKSPIKLLRASS